MAVPKLVDETISDNFKHRQSECVALKLFAEAATFIKIPKKLLRYINVSFRRFKTD